MPKKTHTSDNLVLSDAAGRIRIAMFADFSGEGPRISLSDSNEHERIVLAVRTPGDTPVASLLDENGQSIAGLAMDNDGGFTVNVVNSEGSRVLTLEVSDKGNRIVLSHKGEVHHKKIQF